MLADEQIDRYSRQIILPQVGGKGQERLLQARVLVVGTGDAQISALLYLAAAGVGTVGVIVDRNIDKDRGREWGCGSLSLSQISVSKSLLRAFLTDGPDAERIGKLLSALNPDCTVKTHIPEREGQVTELVEAYDLVLAPPHPIHDICYARGRPFICGASLPCSSWLLTCQGYQSGFPCLHCLRSHSPFNSSEGPPSGVLARMAAGFLGTLQATEAIKLILRVGQTASDQALVWDFPSLRFSRISVVKDSACSLCIASC